jgi:serine/threonine-protein kinase
VIPPGGDGLREGDAALPRNWRELTPLVDRLLEAPTEQRAALITELCAGDPVRGADLERLVAECERDMPLLDRPAVERFDQLVGDEAALPLPEVLGGRYRITRELGSGGMARVYLAQDVKHARSVAVKVIRPELAASLGRDRFLREIGIAARLRHPNIMPLYDSGDADGVLYFVMPYEAGLSLKSRLKAGQSFTTTDAVSVLRDVARALACAHEQGVVHRDVKPDNVMLSGGAAVVADFGIAKAFTAAQTDARGGTITQTGVVIGTPAYMAPEQAIGDPTTDHRADIYSFGCLAYELFVGASPFAGPSTYQIIAAQISTRPKLVSDSRSDVPEAVVRLIDRCLEKNPADRPQRAQELVDVLEAAPVATTESSHRRRRPAMRTPVLIGVTAIVVLAGIVIARGSLATADDASGQVTIAVLPLSSVGGDSLQPLVAEGFGDDIATALVRFPWVRVKSRRGVGNYRGQRDLDVEAIGRELGARFLVTGSFRDIGGRLTVQAQLLNSADGAVLWADQFAPSGELAAVRDEIARTISDSLRSRAGGATRTNVGAAPGARRGKGAAYQTYLVAQRKFAQRGQSISTSIELFREAIALDTLLAEAYSGLSLALALSPAFQGVAPGSVSVEATAMARRALQLDPTLAGPHTALGLVLQHGYQWAASETEFRRALDLDGHDVEARLQYGRHLEARGRMPEALAQFRAAREDDPASALVASNMVGVWLAEGQMDSALAQSSRALKLDPLSLPAVGMGASVLALLGRKREARELIERNPPWQNNSLYVFGLIGDTARVREILKAMSAVRPRPGTIETGTAFAMLGLGDTARALVALERATDAKEIWPTWGVTRFRVNEGFTKSARFRALLDRVGLTGK